MTSHEVCDKDGKGSNGGFKKNRRREIGIDHFVIYLYFNIIFPYILSHVSSTNKLTYLNFWMK